MGSEWTWRVRAGLAGRPVRAVASRAMAQPPQPPGGQVPRVTEPWLTPGRLLTLAATLLLAYAGFQIVRALRTVLVMLLVSLFLAFAMEPAVQWLAQRGWRRGAATALVFAGVLLGGAAVVASILPLVIDQVGQLLRSIPRSFAEVDQLLARLPFEVRIEPGSDVQAELVRLSRGFGAELQDVLLGAAGNVVTIGATVLGVVLQLFTVALVTFYLVADGPRLRRTLAGPLPPERQRELLAIWEIAVAKTGGYIYSRLLLAVVAAAATSAFLLLVGVPYPLPLGLWVGITGAFVPVLGTYLGGLLALLIAVANNPPDALWVLGFLIVYQLVDNYLLAPRLQSQTMDVHPAVAFVSVVVGGTLLGAVGALLALPATAIIQAVASTYMHRHELIAELAEEAATERNRGQVDAAPLGDPDPAAHEAPA